ALLRFSLIVRGPRAQRERWTDAERDVGARDESLGRGVRVPVRQHAAAVRGIAIQMIGVPQRGTDGPARAVPRRRRADGIVGEAVVEREDTVGGVTRRAE